MDSVTVGAAVAAMEMPRLGDGTANLREPWRVLPGQVVDEIMRATSISYCTSTVARRALWSVPSICTVTRSAA